MSDIPQQQTEEQAPLPQAEDRAEKPITIRLDLKEGEYRRLCEAARTLGCHTEELVERCVRTLLES